MHPSHQTTAADNVGSMPALAFGRRLDGLSWHIALALPRKALRQPLVMSARRIDHHRSGQDRKGNGASW
jgi:hypothetical protein